MNILGESIKKLRLNHKMTQSELGKLTGFKQNTISQHEKGKRDIDEEDILKYCRAFGISPQVLFDMSSNKRTSKELSIIYNKLDSNRQSKVYDYASRQLDEQNGIQEEKVVYLVRGRQSAAGSMIHVDDVDAEMGVLPSSIVPNGANELVRITGDSMEPVIKKGSEVYLRYQPTVEDGEVAIVRVEDEGVTCKYLYRDGKNVILKSENPKYEDLIVDAEKVSVIGKVLL